MVAPRTLVFRPLVKGNEASGNQIATNVVIHTRHERSQRILNLIGMAGRDMKLRPRLPKNMIDLPLMEGIQLLSKG